jgi:glycosyltransferase involved in cell wall biosynthesis
MAAPPARRSPALSIVVCTRDRSVLLDRCLASMRDHGLDDSVEVLVVDNGSTDATPEVAATWARRLPIVYVREPEVGLSNARNRAIAEARGDVLVFVDDDVTVRPTWLAGYREALQPDVAGAAGRVLLHWPEGRPSWLRPEREAWFARLDLGDELRPLAPGERPVGANMGVRRDLARELGGFDPGLGYSGRHLMGNEETDFFDRIATAGHRVVYAPAAEVLHHVEGRRVTRRYLVRRLYAQGRTDVRQARPSRGGSGDSGHASGRSVAAVATAALLRGWGSDARRIVRERPVDRSVTEVALRRARLLGRLRESLARGA